MASTKRNKWQLPPAPTPRIIHLPRRTRRSRATVQPPSATGKPPRPPAPIRNLAALLDQEKRTRAEAAVAAKATATATSSSGESSSDEERWRFQAEILRAECNFLRMEREMALKKLDKNQAQMETALRSAMNTLVSGRKKIDGSESVAAAMDAEIETLEEKMSELTLGGRIRTGTRSKNDSFGELRRSCRRNFDWQASVLRRRLERMEDASIKDIREIEECNKQGAAKDGNEDEDRDDDEEHLEEKDNIVYEPNRNRRFTDVEMLRRKMEGLSKGMLERMEECSYLLLSTNNNNCSSDSSNKRSGCSQRVIRSSTEADKAHRQYCQQPQLQLQGKQVGERMGLLSCCNCKEVVGRIMQQVKAETDQWSEMQGILEQVKVEMEELRSSRDLWQQRAIASEINFHSLHTQMLEWKQRARSSEQKMIELQRLVTELQNEIQPLRAEHSSAPISTASPLHSELWIADQPRIKSRQQRSLDSQKEKEKHVLVYHSKPQRNMKRSPLRDIKNIANPSSHDIEFAIQRT